MLPVLFGEAIWHKVALATIKMQINPTSNYYGSN